MPRLTNEELKNVEYVSMVDFCRKIRTYENMDDKLRFTTQYLLSYGKGNRTPDYTLEEATYIAQMAIASSSKVQKELMGNENRELLSNNPQIVNPHVKDPKEDLAHELFMNDPCKFLRGYAEKKIRQIENSDVRKHSDNELRDNCEYLLQEKLDVLNFSDDVYDMVSKPTNVGIKLRAELMLGGKKELEDLYNASRPKFYSRFFGTASNASKNLDTAYKMFNDPKNAHFGNKETIRNAANQYLQHKFPEWRPGDDYPEYDAANYSDAELARIKLSMTMLDATSRQEDFENSFKNLVDETKKKEIKFSDADRPPLNQNIFRDNVNKDVNENDVNEIDNSFEIDGPSYEKEKDKEEVSELDIEELTKNMVPDKND